MFGLSAAEVAMALRMDGFENVRLLYGGYNAADGTFARETLGDGVLLAPEMMAMRPPSA